MRKLLSLLLVAAVVAGAGGVRADLGPPVHVRILGEPRAAEPGVPYKAQLQIEVGAPLALSGLKFEAAGWSQLAFAVPARLEVAKDRPQVFDFEVVTTDPTEPLVLNFDVDGFACTRTFDLSPAGIAFVRGPNPVSKVDAADDAPPLTPETSVSPAPPPGDSPAARPSTPDKGRNIRVHGRFVYQRSDGYTIGADGVAVRVRDDDTFGYDQLAVEATDAQGYYDITFWWDGDIFDSQPDIYLYFEAANSAIRVESPTVGSGAYGWQTGVTNDYSGADLDYGTLQPSDINQHPALHILTDLVRTWRWWYGYGYNTPFVAANWPNGTSGAFYNGEIYVSTGEQWQEQTHTHEYGHHWVGTYALSPAPDYCNGICDASPTDCGHCLWCEETVNISFTEGFPDWMGDVIPRTFAASYGRAARYAYDMENLYTCGGSYDDPTKTEGFFAAVVRDIGDNTNDDHAAYPETDELAVGWGPVITTVDLDAPTTATAFLTAFKSRYPSYREGEWATAKNCNYETDVSAPPTVTSLHSTSHTVNVSSPDATIDFAWTRAYDDASGVEGYGLFVSSGPGLPSAVMDIGDVTTYTTPALTPGTYYLNIRTLDRSGKWGATYASAGPYIVREATPANLAHYLYSGWDKVLVPRSTNDASFASVPAPTTLPGNAAGTYWNVGFWNAGESSTEVGSYDRLYIDSVYTWWLYSGALASHGGAYGCNMGPATVRGGRHTFESSLDATDLVAESNETDNRWAHQWVWTPLTLSPGDAITRSAPPLRTGGWDAVTDGSTLYANSDGLRMTAYGWWNAAVLRPLSATADHDLYMHAASTGAGDGFASILTSSSRGSGYLDAVIANRNVLGAIDHDIGVVNYDGEMSNYEVEHAYSQNFVFGDSLTVPFAANQMLRLWEFYVSSANVGPVSITVDVDPAYGPLRAHWLNKDFQRGGLYTYSAAAWTDDTGRARLDVSIPDVGYNALVVWRDPSWEKANDAINVTIEIDTTPPDFIPLLASGWYAPIVPRAAADGTGSSVPAPTTLPGNAASTYFNVAVRNESPSSSPAGLPAQIHLDGVSGWWVAWGAFPAYGNGLFNWTTPWTVRGGRHTLVWKPDAVNEIEEMHEDNNNYGEQWVWSPYELTHDTPVTRSAPPDQTGGWADVGTGETLYPNCDGVRMPNAGSYWRGVAVMPSGASDVDLRLHQPSTGAKDGFASSLAGSYAWAGYPDFVLVNFNLTASQAYDAGVVRYSGSSSYTVESTATSGWITNPNGTYGAYSLPAGRILNLVEVYLPVGQTGIHLINLTGNVNWGLALYGPDLIYQAKSQYHGMVTGGIGVGQDELLVSDITAAGWYCVAVFKVGTADLPLAGTYNLVMKPMWASDVGDLPTVASTALVDVSPNPFNPQTKITYDLAHAGPVRLEVYDLQGRRIRTLVDAEQSAGRHLETWAGVDDAGGGVASGLYMVRLTADGTTQMLKMTLLK